MSDAKISIIVPVYNAEEYLNKCIDSIINQTYKNIEIICVDDESTDGSVDILNDYARKDSRVRVICLKNSGVSRARTEGINRSTGEYVMFVDSDDWLDVDACRLALKEITQNSADVVMWPYIKEFGESSQKKNIFSENKIFEGDSIKRLHAKFIGPLNGELKNPENTDALSTVWGKLYRREVVLGIQFIDLDLIGSYEDGLFNLYVFKNVKKAVYFNEYLYHYRKNNPKSITSVYNQNLEQHRHEIYRLMRVYIEENDYGDLYKSALDNRISFEILYLGLNKINSKISELQKIRELKRLISSEEYKKAVKGFQIRFFPVHWKVFFFFAKYKMPIGLYLMLKLITFIRKK